MSKRVICFLLLGVAVAHSQSGAFRPADAIGLAVDTPLLDQEQPSVFIAFEKVGKCRPLFVNDDWERIFLRLKNNTRWRIRIKANGVPNDCYGDALPWYRVEADPSARPDGPIPYGRGVDVASSVELDTGASLKFSVPRTHLDPGLSIKIDFQFGWEENNRNTRHSTYFSYWDLPNALRNPEKEEKLKCVSGLCLPELKVLPPPKPTELPEPPPVMSAPLTIPDLPGMILQPPRN